MSTLTDRMKALLADNFSMYLKAHNFHWNVEGANFVEYHKFFGDVYQDLWGAVDVIAEQIRALGEYAPGSYEEFFAHGRIAGANMLTPMPARQMVSVLRDDNRTLIEDLNAAFKEAQVAQNQGLMNFLADRLDRHAKLGWQLAALCR